jgi:hypothetical protein
VRFFPLPPLRRTPNNTQHLRTTYIYIHHPTAIPTPENAKNHTPGFAQGARTEAAHTAALRTATLLARTAFRVHADSAFCARVRAAYEAGSIAPTAAGPTGAGSSAPAVAVVTGANGNSALRRVDAGGGTNSSTGSGDAKLMVRARGASPSY